MPIPDKFIQIDEEGYPLSQELRIQDYHAGEEIFENLTLHDSGTLISTFGEVPVIVEAFDEPFVAQQIIREKNQWILILPYGVEFNFDLKSLSVDEWDRFHGYTEKNIPFVMSRKAQALFFEELDEFDDDSITSAGKKYDVPPYWPARPELEKEKFWTNVYLKEKNPGWNLGEPAQALQDMLPRLKLPKSRVLVLGCGEGHDAAHFAKEGHVVTAVDISPEAIQRAKALYTSVKNLTFIEADIFKLPAEFNKSFDIIFEHTCYCAINPQKRPELVKIWNRLLTDQGQLMGVFFAFERRNGPPYGGSERELRQRLKANYLPLFWGRWQASLASRQGKELFIFMQKKSQ